VTILYRERKESALAIHYEISENPRRGFIAPNAKVFNEKLPRGKITSLHYCSQRSALSRQGINVIFQEIYTASYEYILTVGPGPTDYYYAVML
jgi:hypothetical protein